MIGNLCARLLQRIIDGEDKQNPPGGGSRASIAARHPPKVGRLHKARLVSIG